MPTYVYKFLDSGETIEVQQAFTDDSLTEYVHPESGAVLPVKKVFQPVGVTFKGSGFFKTDNRGTSAVATSGSSDGGRDSAGSASESKSEGTASKDSKSDSSSSTKSDSSSNAKKTKDTKAAKTPAAAGKND